MPTRPFPRTTWLTSTPKRRISPRNASTSGLAGGSTVTYRAGTPKLARETATFASPPPQVATNCGDCRNRSNPGGARRSMTSPNVTTSVGMKPVFYQGLALVRLHDCGVQGKRGIERGQALHRHQGAGGQGVGVHEVAPYRTHLIDHGTVERIDV